MVKIRLSRGGAKRQPFYHIVVTDSRNRRDGRNIERLGYFNPVARGKDERLRVDHQRVEQWLEHGAQISQRVRHLVDEAVETGATGTTQATEAGKTKPTAEA